MIVIQFFREEGDVTRNLLFQNGYRHTLLIGKKEMGLDDVAHMDKMMMDK